MMPRLLVLNNYSLERVADEVSRGLKPAHHLFGVDRFKRMGYEVSLVPCNELQSSGSGCGALSRIARLLPPMGDLRQQLLALRALPKADLIYAPCQTQTQTLSYLRALGLVRIPIVALAHHPILRSKWPWMMPFLRLQLIGTDAFPALGEIVSKQINEISGCATLSKVVRWGPDLSYYPRPDGSPGFGAVSAGRTGRDFSLFARAVAEAQVSASIYCLQSGMQAGELTRSDHLSIRQVRKEADLSYLELIPALACARVHAIPLVSGFSLSGLTSLTDALALGKPVILTRQPYIDIDVEKEGIGVWVDLGDLQGWVRALRWFDSHPSEAVAMGMRARAFAERHCNLDLFVDDMRRIFDQLLTAKA